MADKKLGPRGKRPDLRIIYISKTTRKKALGRIRFRRREAENCEWHFLISALA